MPRSSLANRFSKCISRPKIDIRGYATRSRLSRDLKNCSLLLLLLKFAIISYKWHWIINVRSTRQNIMFQADDVAEPLNKPLYARVISLAVDLYNS